jgi:hypothetical protein
MDESKIREPISNYHSEPLVVSERGQNLKQSVATCDSAKDIVPSKDKAFSFATTKEKKRFDGFE